MEEVIREKDKGVSAIVGTILIVAITVVLAATVYGVLTGFGGLISGSAPTGSITVSQSSTSITVTLNSISKSVDLNNTQLKIAAGSSTEVFTYTYSATAPTYSGTAPTGTTITGITVNTPAKMSATTVITIAGTGLSTVTSISIVDTSPSGTIASWSS